MFVTVVKYRVKEADQKAFCQENKAYARKVLKPLKGFIRQSLLRHFHDPERVEVVEEWTSGRAFVRFANGNYEERSMTVPCRIEGSNMYRGL